jgi:di/tricarboxylate transporter
MSVPAWISLAIVVGIVVALMRRRAPPSDVLFLSGLAIATLAGAVDFETALKGFANPAVITVGALFVVAAGLKSTGGLDFLSTKLLGKARDERSAIRRLALPIVGFSAFLNNTPIVAMLVPITVNWCRRARVSPSKMLIPISYLTVLGGMCTLIGTSTNLVVNGLLIQEHQRVVVRNGHSQPAYDEATRRALRPMHLFEVGYVGLPVALVGCAYFLLWGWRRLPNRTELVEKLGEERREYLVEILVQPECRLVGQTVEQAGLRNLPGLFLIEIDREGETITPVTPEDVIHAHDRLIFTGIVSTIVDLERIPGLVPAADMTYEFHPRQRQRRHLTEAVLSGSSPLIGTTVKKARFRQLYNAAVVAVHRNGHRLTNKIGDIVLEPGDTLLLQTRTEFSDAFRNSPDFALVASLQGSQVGRTDRAWLAAGLLLLLVIALSVAPLFKAEAGISALAAIGAAVLMVVSRCLSPSEARSALDLQVLVTIAASFGIGAALTKSGAAREVSDFVVGLVGTDHKFLLLCLFYFLAVAFTEVLSNNAVAALMFPLAVAVAQSADCNPRTFIMALTIGASAGFMTPIGYQTNLMVMGPGGYEPLDYFKAGWPLTLLVAVVTLGLAPIFWPL